MSDEDRRRAERYSPTGARVEAHQMAFSPPGAKVKAKRTGTILGLFGTGEDIGGELMDVSGLGLRFVATQKLQLGARLKLVIQFTQSSETLECVGTIRWTHPHAKPDRFVAGVEFEKLGDTQLELLSKVRRAMK